MRLISRLSEGSVRSEASGDSYFGSTMFSVDLEVLAASWRGTLDREALRSAVEGSVRMRIRLMRLSAADAKQRVPDRICGTTTSETHVALQGDSLHIDVDVEAPLDPALDSDGDPAQATSE